MKKSKKVLTNKKKRFNELLTKLYVVEEEKTLEMATKHIWENINKALFNRLGLIEPVEA